MTHSDRTRISERILTIILTILAIVLLGSVAILSKPDDLTSEASETQPFTWIKIALTPTTYRLVDTDHNAVCYYTDKGTNGAISCLPLERESDKE